MVDRLVNTEVNAQRIAAVEQNFGSSGQSLADPNRVLVGEGILTKLCRKKPKPRQFFLCNDILIYGTIAGKKKYTNQHIMSLRDMKIEEIPEPPQPITPVYTDDVNNGSETLRNGWLIISPSKSFAVYAQTAMEKQEWMSHMTRCIEDERTKAGITHEPDEAAPAWVPDVDAPSCMRCEKVKFSALNRRHHCRKCGYVVCGNCSSHKAIIPNQASKPLRVCNKCYHDISNNGSINPSHSSAKKSSLLHKLSSKDKSNAQNISMRAPQAAIDSTDSDSDN